MVEVVAAVLLVSGMAVASDLHVTAPDQTPVRWLDWIGEHGPTVVLVWASWAPGARESLGQVPAFRRAAAGHGLGFVVVAVQEEFAAAASRLSPTGANWLHDRHGAVLKEYRLIRVPYVVVVDASGQITTRAEPRPPALVEALAGG